MEIWCSAFVQATLFSWDCEAGKEKAALAECWLNIAVMANLLVNKSDGKFEDRVLKTSTIAAACFLITVFAMTKILMMTTKGYPMDFESHDLYFPKILGFTTFLLGIISLSVFIALSGWIKSKKTGIFTTVVGVITLILTLLSL